MRNGKKYAALMLAMAVAVTGIPAQPVMATQTGEVPAETEVAPEDAYSLVWRDEFEGTELNREDWNVELHEKGWVNSELQEYVDSADNISVHDGKLYITPIKEEVAGGAQNMVPDDAAVNGSFEVAADELEGDPWDVQKLCEGLSLENGKTYFMSFDASSTVARPIQAGTQLRGGDYHSFGDITAQLTTETQNFKLLFTMSEDADGTAGVYFNMGKMDMGVDESENPIATPASTITIANVKLVEAETVFASTESSNVQGEWTIDSENMGANPWDVQKLDGVSLEDGKTYLVTYKAKATAARTIVAGVQKTSDGYDQYGQVTQALTSELKEYSYTFAKEGDDENAGLYFNLGKASAGETADATITISDVKLIDISGGSAAPKTKYTSGRISTQNKKTFTYGKFEACAKVPAGKGYLPAFWLMANNENIYGQWPRCGEIDCMEVMGQEPEKVYGTIHYGNPHGESQGTLLTTETAAIEKNFAEDFHTFTCEWEPGKITWYVDGIKYHEERDWHSTTEGVGTLSYPAPFDQPFYVILNLAVGGSWVGNPDETTSFDNNPFVIDYVRVYQKNEYNENVEKPEGPASREPVEGNYIYNGTFEDESLTDTVNWQFLTAAEGVGSASISENEITIETTNEGTEAHSIQLVQADVPLEKGATYEVKFDAYASAEREMGVDIKAPKRGWVTYMPHMAAALTTQKQTFTQTFKMGAATDPQARLEFNLGKLNSTATVYISNVSIVKTIEADPEEANKKTVLSNGNYIYNGNFQEGTGHLGDWEFENEDQATISVTGFTDGRRLKVTPNADAQTAVVMKQTDLAFTEGVPYAFSFDAQASEEATLVATVGGVQFNTELEPSLSANTITYEIPATTEFASQDVSFTFDTNAEIYLDNIRLVENAMIKNGSFNDGMTGYEVYVDSSANASYVVDSLQEDNAFSATVNNTSDADWKIQLKQNNVKLEQGQDYVLTFKAKSSLPRKIRAIMQGGEARGYSAYSDMGDDSKGIVELTDEFQTFTNEFTMLEEDDAEAFLSICLGKIDEEITTPHTVVIDDITLVKAEDAEDPEDPVTPTPVAPTQTPAPTPAPTQVPAVTTVGAEVTTDNANMTFVLTGENEVAVTAVTGTKKVTIPATVKDVNGNEYIVTTITKDTFKKNTAVTSVVIPETITTIKADVFKKCKKLKTITIKSTKLTKKSIKNCLKGSKITTVKVPKSKYKAYKKLFTKKICGKNVVLKKIKG